jgi:hypothetical protein
VKLTFLKSVIFLSLTQVSFAQEDYGNLFNQMGNEVVENYFEPLSGNVGAAYNGGWLGQLPSKEWFDFKPTFSFVAGFSYVRGENKRFSTNVNMKLTPELVNRLISNTPSEVYEEPLDEAFNSIDPSLITAIGQDRIDSIKTSETQRIKEDLSSQISSQLNGFNVGISGPTLTGSSDEQVKLNWSEKELQIQMKIVEKVSLNETVTVNGITQTIQKDTTLNIIDSTITIPIPAQEIETGLIGLMDNIPLIAGLAPQIGLGSFAGTQVSFRYLPSYRLELDGVDFGSLEYQGWSIQHDITFWFDKITNTEAPEWNIILMYAQQDIDAFNLLKLNTQKAGVFISDSYNAYDIVSFKPYLGWTYDRNTLEINFGKGIGFLEEAIEGPALTGLDISLEYSTSWERQTSIGMIISFMEFIEIQTEGSFGKYQTMFTRLAIGF